MKNIQGPETRVLLYYTDGGKQHSAKHSTRM